MLDGGKLMNANPVKIEIMDTTLRDGEQTNGVSFMPHEKLMIAKALLQDLNVDRIEVASARVSDGEWKAVRNICQWAEQAGRIDRVEVLGFVDGRTSLDWIHTSGCRHINLLCKGSENHCRNQLKKTLEEHVTDIRRSLAYAEDSVREEVVYNELMVPVGGESFVMLEDSSRVWLNADSRLRYPSRFEGEERRIELEGEAYFEVRRGERPFVVETSRGDVRVLGTSFDVRAYGDEAMTATLVTGRVRYEGEGEKVTLAPGEQVRVSDGGKVEKRQVDVEEYVGWREGVYVFDKRPLADIMRDLERWYGVDIVFMTEELKGLPFTGYVERYDKIDTFLDLLRSTGELTYSVDDKRIYLMRK